MSSLQIAFRPQRLYGAAVFAVGALTLTAAMGSQSLRLFAYGLTPIICLAFAVWRAGNIDGRADRSLSAMIRHWLVFGLAVGSASLLIITPRSPIDAVQALAHVFAYSALLYILLATALLIKPYVRSYFARVAIVFVLASLLSTAQYVLAANRSEDRASPVIAGIRPWLGFWPGVIGAADPEIVIDLPVTPD